MKCGAICIFLGLAARLMAGAETTASPQELAARFVTAFNAGDTEMIKATCAEPFWTARYDSPQKLIRQGYGSGRVWLLESRAVEVRGERAVIDIIVLRASDNRPADAIFLYAEKRNGAWLLHALNEDKSFRTMFLAGVVSADFNLNNLPSDAGMEALGQRLLPIMAGFPEELSWELFEQLTASSFSVSASARRTISLPVLGSVKRPASVRARWEARLQRGALEIAEEETEENMFPEKMVMYLHRTAEGWELYNAGGVLATSLYLEFSLTE